jgi:hypothetical protein
MQVGIFLYILSKFPYKILGGVHGSSWIGFGVNLPLDLILSGGKLPNLLPPNGLGETIHAPTFEWTVGSGGPPAMIAQTHVLGFYVS